MLTSYHNHTDWSDGNATISGQITAACALGLDELGISDHYVAHPGGVVEWSMPLDLLGEYVKAIQDAAATERNLRVRIGIEADYFPETVDSVRTSLAEQPLDYVIGSVHYVDGFPIDEDAANWQALSADGVVDCWRLYWLRIGELARSGVYDFVGHLDLPKKFGFRPAADLTAEVDAALDAIAESDMAIEINTAGWYKPVREAYPDSRLLHAARERGIPLLINADAHHPDHLIRDFHRARDLARSAGYTELVRYERRHRHPIPL